MGFQELFYRGGWDLKKNWPANFSDCGRPCAERCHAPGPEEECYAKVKWAKSTGVLRHPDKFGGLTHSSSFSEFQMFLFKHGHTLAGCGPPCLPNPMETWTRRRHRRRRPNHDE